MEDISSFYPRLEGTQGERDTIAYITQQLDNDNIDYELQDIQIPRQIHSFSQNIIVRMEGTSRDTLLYLIPMNHPEGVSQNQDGSVNIAIGLSIIKELAHSALDYSVEVVFLGAEFGDTAAYPLGTRRYLHDSHFNYRIAAFYTGFKSIPERVMIIPGSGGTISPPWLISQISSLFKRRSIPFLTMGNINQLLRLNSFSNTNPSHEYIDNEIPTLYFSDTEYTPYQDSLDPDEWVFSFLRTLHEITVTESFSFYDTWDRHFLFFQVTDIFFVIPELSYIYFILSFFSFAFIYGLVRPVRVLYRIRILVVRFINIPILYGLLFGFLFLATIFITQFLQFREFPLLWEYYPQLFFLIKMLIIFLLYFLFFNFFHYLPFSQRPDFYSTSAIFMFIFSFFAALFFNISLTYYFIWGLFFAIIFSVSKGVIVRILAFIISAYWIVKAVIDVLFLPDLQTAEFIILNPVSANLVLAFLLFPYIMFFLALINQYHKAGLRVIFYILPAIVGVLLISIVSLLSLLYFQDPYTQDNQQIIHADQNYNADTNEGILSLTSETNIGRTNIRLFNRSIFTDIHTSHREFSFTRETDDIVTFQHSSESFLQRSLHQLNLNFQTVPERLRLRLSFSEPATIYDCNFPFHYLNARNEAEIIIGARPPENITLTITLPESIDTTCSFTFIFSNRLLNNTSVDTNSGVVSSLLTIREEFLLP